MSVVSTQILNHTQVAQKIKRIAIEIIENNLDERDLVLVGIYDKGYKLAALLQSQLADLNMQTLLVKLEINKMNPLTEGIDIDCPFEKLENKVVILVDDVLNSGRTMIYGIKTLLTVNVKKIETVVLVERTHKRFPVHANYKGYELATALTEHIEVQLNEQMQVILF